MSLETRLAYFDRVVRLRLAELTPDETAEYNTLRLRRGEDIPLWSLNPVALVFARGCQSGRLVEAVLVDGRRTRFKVGSARLDVIHLLSLGRVSMNACGQLPGDEDGSSSDINLVTCAPCLAQYGGEDVDVDEADTTINTREMHDVEEIQRRGVVFGLPGSRHYLYASPPGRISIFPLFPDVFVSAREMTKKKGRWE